LRIAPQLRRSYLADPMTRIVYAPPPRRRRDPSARIRPLPTIVRAKRAQLAESDPTSAENRPVEDVFKRLAAAMRAPRGGK